MVNEWPPVEKDEYEIQFYDKAGRELFNELKACFAESLEDSLEPTLKALEKQLPEKKKAVFGEQLKVLPKLMEELIESNAASLKKLQLMVEEKIFSIPKDVVLPGDIPQVNYDQKDAGKVENDIQKLMARYEAVRFVKKAVDEEIKTHETVVGKIETLINQTEAIAKNVVENTILPPTLAALASISKNQN